MSQQGGSPWAAGRVASVRPELRSLERLVAIKGSNDDGSMLGNS
jgi:hypothetical protein